MAAPNPFAALRPDERDRLERFGRAFDGLDPLLYENYGVGAADAASLEEARRAAMRAIGTGEARRNAVRAAVREFTDTADRAVAGRHEYPAILLTGRFSSPRAADRVSMLQSLERAVVAVVVWNELTVDERDVLLGPWAQFAEMALAG